MASEARPVDLEAQPAYGSVPPRVPGGRRQQGILEKEKARSNVRRSTGPGKSKTREQYRGEHTPIYSMLRRHSHRPQAVAYRFLLYTLVILSVFNFVLESDPWLRQHYATYFEVLEAITSVLFMIDYILKISTAEQRKCFAREEPDQARLKFIFSMESFVDVASFLPYFVETFSGTSRHKYVTLQVMRCIRIFKLALVADSFRMVERVLYFNGRILLMAWLVCSIMLLGCSVAIYFTRPQGKYKTNDTDDDFGSILSCMYLAILMLTGQGGPVGIMPWYTRVIIVVTALFAIAQFAIPASMLTWGFEQEAEHDIVKRADREKRVAEQVAKGISIPDSSSSSDLTTREEEWTGYLEQVVGSDSEESLDEESMERTRTLNVQADRHLLEAESDVHLTPDERKRVIQIYKQLDTDKLGIIDLDKIRAITETDDEAKELLGQLSSFIRIEGSSDVTLREFLLWIVHVKTKYERYGDKIYQRLIMRMESALKQRKRAATRASKGFMKLLRKKGESAEEAIVKETDGSTGGSPRQRESAAEVEKSAAANKSPSNEELERQNLDLQSQVEALQQEVAALKEVP